MAYGAEYWVPALVAGLSSGVGYYNNQRTLQQQNDATIAGQQTQKKLQDQANSSVNQELTNLSRSNADASQKQSQAAFTTQLQRTRAAAQASTPAVSGADARYGAQVTAGQNANATSDATQADLMSKIAAPSLQRQQEGVGMQDLGATLSRIQGASAGQDFLTQLRARSAQANPWLTALAAAGQGAASGMASRIPSANSSTIWPTSLSGLPGKTQLYDNVGPQQVYA